MSYLGRESLATVDLSKVCWRLRDATVYHRVMAVLRQRLVFSRDVWQYGFLHGDVPAMREVLAQSSMPFVSPHQVLYMAA